MENGAETSSTSPSTKTKPTVFKAQIQAHTHWANDVVLVQNNSALVSASSDMTVKVWRPQGHDGTTAQTIGLHSDYVKCLTTPDSTSSWVASGGLDHKICLWDLDGAGKTLQINVGKSEGLVKGSIYALCATRSILASGGPESVVRLWDPKTGKGITKLVGHTDNVRDILISEDGDMLLTASSDQTVKVWSTVAGRCMHTLTMHSDSVWCMYSDHPRLEVFYSGDRSGLVAKTDVRRAVDFDEGISVAVCQEQDGIARIVTSGDFIWTATASSSLNRWRDVNTALEIETPPASPRHERTLSMASGHEDPDTRPSSPFPATNGVIHESTIPYTGILQMSITAPHPGRKSQQRKNSLSPTSFPKTSDVILDTDLQYVIPIEPLPVETIEGQNGLIKHHMLNDKKRVLTVDTAGEVVLWDLLKVGKAVARQYSL